MSGGQKRFAEAREGDLQIAARPGASVWIGDRASGGLVRVTADEVRMPSAAAGGLVVGGSDVGHRIGAIPATPGVGDGNVTAVHLAPGSIGTDKIGGVIGGAAGGTGRGDLPAGAAAVASASGGLEGRPELTLSPGDGGLSVAGSVELSGGGSLGAAGDIAGRSLLSLVRGAPPSISSASLGGGGASLDWTAEDADGDLRRVMVKYSPAAPAAPAVAAAPDDWFEVDEGGAHQVYVGSGSGAPPFYGFFRDRQGTLPLLRSAGGAMVLHAGRSYRFRRTEGSAAGHPFWVGASAAEGFSGFPIEGPPGSSHAAGIDSAEGFVQLEIPRGWSGALNYYCTAHAGMSRAFDVRPASPAFDRDPVAVLGGSFDASGHSATSAHLVAEDSAGNLSAVVSVPVP